MSAPDYSGFSTYKKRANNPRYSTLKGKRRSKKAFRKKIKKFHFNRQIVPILGHKRRNYLIIEDGHDFTPKPLYDDEFPSVSIDKTLSSLPFSKAGVGHSSAMGKLRSERSSRVSMSSIKTFRTSHSVFQSFKTSSNVNESRMTLIEGSISMDLLSRFSLSGFSCESEEILLENKPPSLFRLREDPPLKNSTIQNTFKVSLQENETLFLLSIDSTSDYQESESGQVILNRNLIFEDLATATKSISQSTKATQTAMSGNVRKQKFSLISRNTRQTTGVFAANWDIYDTYKELDLLTNSDLNFALTEERKIDKLTTISDDTDSDFFSNIYYMGVHLGKPFFDTAVIMERLITAYNYQEKQLLYQGLYEQDPLSLNLEYKYSLKLLWTYNQDNTKDKVVTSISLSPVNENIIAVGYGKFKYTDLKKGLVCCWNIKNPSNPERIYYFEKPVTCVSFSSQHPNILAVSFYSGLLILLDVTKVFQKITASNQLYPQFHPVKKVCWFASEDKDNDDFTVTCGKDGKIFRYRKTAFFTSKQILSVTRIDGKLQGSDQLRKCYPKTFVCRHPAAECMVPHPVNPVMYYIGTSDGNVYKCSINYCHHHLEVFTAHNGPVYGIEFHPFCEKVFLTYGGDWCIKVWAEGVFEPLITLISGMQSVEAAVWHPINSTIIVSITGKCIEVWDIRRKTYHPKSSTESPSKSFNTALKFTKNGYNICVGDADGNLHVLALAEMPFSPEFQELVLVQSIKKTLISKPELLSKLNKLGPPFNETHDAKKKLQRTLNSFYKPV